MQSITYINSEGRRAVFGMDPPYLQGHIDGAGELEAELHAERAAGVDGFMDRGALLSAREIAITGTVVSRTGRAVMYGLREELAAVLNPKLSGWITYTNDRGKWRIRARPRKLPEYMR